MKEFINPFLNSNGNMIRSLNEWDDQKECFKDILINELYGTFPKYEGRLRVIPVAKNVIYDGKAIKEIVDLDLFNSSDKIQTIEITRPNLSGRFPVVVWNRGTFKGITESCPIEEELVCCEHIVLLKYNRQQLVADGPQKGILDEFYPNYTWGKIAQWAWLSSRVADYLDTTSFSDHGKYIVTGHSRGGKVSLCAGIFDERFSIVSANGSGCGGAGSFHFRGSRYGLNTGNCETISSIVKSFPYWWSSDFQKYADNEEQFSVDSHIMRGLVAPRAIITTEGDGDTWSNPFGTLAAWRASQEIFDFEKCRENNAIHYREGGHAYTDMDWKALISYIDFHFFNKEMKDVVYFQKEWTRSKDPFDWRNIKLFYSWEAPDSR